MTNNRSPRRILIVTGGGAHDFAQGRQSFRKFLDSSGRFVVQEAALTENGVAEFVGLSRDHLDAVLMYTQGGKASEGQIEGLVRFVESGGGLVGVHCANDTFRGNERFQQLIGSRFVDHPPGQFDFKIRFTEQARASRHPLATHIDDMVLNDEHYKIEPKADFDVFAVSDYLGATMPMGYTRQQGQGIVVYLANGHHDASLSHPRFQHLLERSLRFACGEAMDPKASARVGLLGYGGIARTHAGLIARQESFSTVAVCDLVPSSVEQARQDLGKDIRTYQQMSDLFADDDVDIVVIALPHHMHASCTVEALKAGKHVVCEKPMCLTLSEADKMIATAEQARRVLTVFHNRRWDPQFLALLDTTQHHCDIGEVFHVEAGRSGYEMPRSIWRECKEISGGVLYDGGAHIADWLLQVMPKRIESVSGNLQKRYWRTTTNEDFAQVHLRFEDGTTANIEQGTLGAISRPEWRILGQRGGIEVECGTITMVLCREGRRLETKLPHLEGDWASFYRNLASHLFLGERLIVCPRQARRVVGVLELAEISSFKGGKPLALPGEDQFEPDFAYPV